MQITDRAGEKLQATLQKAKADPELRIRVEVTLARGGTLRVDRERPGDTTVAFGDRTVLVLDKRTARMYADRKLDFSEGVFCVV